MVTHFFSIRLPLSQTFLTPPVTSTDESKKQISATHTMCMFGIKFLTLYHTAYSILERSLIFKPNMFILLTKLKITSSNQTKNY
jgi:hypothetical protein